MTISHPGPPPVLSGDDRQYDHRSIDGLAADGESRGVTAAVKRYYRRARAAREIERLIRVAPTASIRDDLMNIAARNERWSN